MAYSYNQQVWRPDVSTVPLVSTADASVSTTYQAVLENSLLFSAFSGGIWWFDVPFAADTTISFRLWYALEENREYIYIFAEDDDPPFVDTYLVTNLSTDDDPYGSNPGHGITGRSHGWVTCTATIPANTSYIEIGYVRYDAFWVSQGFSIGPVTLDGVADDLSPGTIWNDFSSVTIQDINDSKDIAFNTNIFSDFGSSNSIYRNFPLDIAFRLRNAIGSSGTTTETATLQYQLNSGGWIDVTTSTPVQLTPSVAFTEGDATAQTALTAFAGPSAFVANVGRTTTNSVSYSLANNKYTEFEFSMKIDSAQVTVNDIVEIRVHTSGGSGLADQIIMPTSGLGDSFYNNWFWGAMPTQDTDDSDNDLGFNLGVEGTYNNRIYRIGGGELHAGDPHDEYPMVVAYDYTLDRWLDIGGRDLIDIYAGGIDMAQCAIVGHKIYVFNATSRDDFDAHVGKLTLIYNIDTDHWTTGTDPPALVGAGATDWWRTDFGCAAALGTNIYVMGGEAKLGGAFKAVAEIHIYDTVNDTWSVGADMPTDGVLNDSNEFPNAVAKGHKLYVATQFYGAAGGDWARLSIYNVNTDSWQLIDPTADLDEAHQWEYGTPMLAPDGTIWITANHPNSDATPDGPGGVGIAIFDPSDESWTNGPAYPWQMSMGQWMTHTQRGYSQYFSPGAQTIFDGPTQRSIPGELVNSVNVRSHGTIGTNMVFTLQDGAAAMVYTGFNPDQTWDVLSSVATIDHDILAGVEPDQHHTKVHFLDERTHDAGLLYKTGTYSVSVSDADFLNPDNAQMVVTYASSTGIKLLWTRSNGTWKAIEI